MYLLFCLAFGLLQPVAAQVNQLDPSFGTGGIILQDFQASFEAGQAILVQEDGKFIVMGSIFGNSEEDVLLLRYNPDGTLDNTFASGGILRYEIGTRSNERAIDMAIQPDGKLVVVGFGQTSNQSEIQLLLIRFNADGSPDMSFGTNGFTQIKAGDTDGTGQGVRLLPDGKLLVAATADTPTTDSDFTLLRFNADGTLDTSYGVDGFVRVDVANRSNVYSDMRLQSDGKVVVFGNDYPDFFAGDAMIARVNADGTIDAEFGTNGVITVGTGGTELAETGLILDNGQILSVGISREGFGDDNDLLLIRMNADGTLDEGFGIGGQKILDTGASIYASKALPAEDGSIYLAGTLIDNENETFFPVLLRLTPELELDTTFGTSGWIAINEKGDLNDLAFLDDESIIATGFQENQPVFNPNVLVARFTISPLTTAIEEFEVPRQFTLDQNYPNPFNPSTTIPFQLEKPAHVVLDVVNLQGQKVATLRDERLSPGSHTVRFDAAQLPAGVYLYRVIVDGVVASRQMTYLP